MNKAQEIVRNASPGWTVFYIVLVVVLALIAKFA